MRKESSAQSVTLARHLADAGMTVTMSHLPPNTRRAPIAGNRRASHRHEQAGHGRSQATLPENEFRESRVASLRNSANQARARLHDAHPIPHPVRCHSVACNANWDLNAKLQFPLQKILWACKSATICAVVAMAGTAAGSTK